MLLLVLVLGVGAWGAVGAFLLMNGMERIPSSELTSLDPVGGGFTNYLLVGSDSRENIPDELSDFFGDFGGQRADVVMVMHASPSGVQMISLPRDLRVSIPGHGTNKINAAYAFGGPDLLVRTVKDATGLPIHHYLEVGFADFADVVDAMGGVDISFPYTARDNKSGLNVEAGTTHVGGIQALAYARSRSYEELRDGSWVSIDANDIGRTARQQQVMGELFGNARSPATFAKWPWIASSMGSALTADSGLGMMDMARLGWALARSGSVDAATLPVYGTTEGGVSYVVADEPAASDLLARFSIGHALTG